MPEYNCWFEDYSVEDASPIVASCEREAAEKYVEKESWLDPEILCSSWVVMVKGANGTKKVEVEIEDVPVFSGHILEESQ